MEGIVFRISSIAPLNGTLFHLSDEAKKQLLLKTVKFSIEPSSPLQIHWNNLGRLLSSTSGRKIDVGVEESQGNSPSAEMLMLMRNSNSAEGDLPCHSLIHGDTILLIINLHQYSCSSITIT
ncbi:hypothetical protein V6N11_063952 [Hibiscus sabdariffa]|uniref:Uncharacterized protein n=1 Tax=Hibiscus sabdariffa TaxID=183260 RepID=A0ABR2PM83_9ROSI